MIVQKELIKMFVACAAFICLAFTASAQRTTAGRGMLSAEAQYPCGASLSYGQYLHSSIWEAGARVQWRNYVINSEYTMPYMPLCAFADWMYRIVGTRSRVFNMYAGAGVFLGWEFYDPGKTLPDFISSSLSSGTFLYGVEAKLQMEVFVSKRLALLFSGVAPFNFSSPCSWIQAYGSLGIRLDL